MFKNTISLPDFTHSPIDIHSHINHGSKFDCEEDDIHVRNLDFLESTYQYYNVSQVGLSTYASLIHSTECVIEENEYMHQLSKEKEWVYQWVVVNPLMKETYAQAEALLSSKKVLGIKIHPDSNGYNILDYGDELFSFANKHKAVLLMHPQHIEKMPVFANKNPDMKLIIAHLGEEEHVDAIANAVHGNIYVDTSGRASSRNNIVEYAVNRVGSHNILFGTDTYSFAFQFGRVALSKLSFEEKENILWKNAVKLFPKALK